MFGSCFRTLTVILVSDSGPLTETILLTGTLREAIWEDVVGKTQGWHAKDLTGRPAKSAGGRLHLNTHTHLIQ